MNSIRIARGEATALAALDDKQKAIEHIQKVKRWLNVGLASKEDIIAALNEALKLIKEA